MMKSKLGQRLKELRLKNKKLPICPSCGTRKGYAMGTGDCGCDCGYKMMTQEQYNILFPDKPLFFKFAK